MQQSGLQEGNTILVVIPKPNHSRQVAKHEPVEMVSDDRPESGYSAQALLEMGYSEEKVANAMEEAMGDPNIALEILINGNSPMADNFYDLGPNRLNPTLRGQDPNQLIVEQPSIDPRIIEGIARCQVPPDGNLFGVLSQNPHFLELKSLLRGNPALFTEFMNSLSSINPLLAITLLAQNNRQLFNYN